MTQNDSIIYPNVDLFLYDLREGLSQNLEEIDSNRRFFWSRIYDDLDNHKLDVLSKQEDLNLEFVELLGSSEVKKFNSIQEGYYRPFLLMGDTYALHIDCSASARGQLNYAPQPIDCFQQIIEFEIQPRISGKPGTLGETWLMWGQLGCDTDAPQAIADLFHSSISQKDNSIGKLRECGTLWGGYLFETWQRPSQSERSNSPHIILWLFPHRDSISSITERVGNSYFPLMRLFAYRSKVTWASRQIIQLKSSLTSDFKRIQALVAKVSQLSQERTGVLSKLASLQPCLVESLEISNRYTYNLNFLNSQILTIKTNSDNYIKRVRLIDSQYIKAEALTHNLSEFHEKFAIKVYEQASVDYKNLSSGLNLIENLTKTIVGITDIYQAQKDRNLNSTIAILGIGLATSQISSSVLVSQSPPSSETLFVYTFAFRWSLLSGVIASLGVWLLLRLFKKL